MAIPRNEILSRLRAQVAAGKPIVGCGAGTGISAKFAEAGGADLIIIYNSGRYRMAGRGSLAGLMPYGDANGIVTEMASEVLPVVKDIPVLAGVCGPAIERRDNELRTTSAAVSGNFHAHRTTIRCRNMTSAMKLHPKNAGLRIWTSGPTRRLRN